MLTAGRRRPSSSQISGGSEGGGHAILGHRLAKVRPFRFVFILLTLESEDLHSHHFCPFVLSDPSDVKRPTGNMLGRSRYRGLHIVPRSVDPMRKVLLPIKIMTNYYYLEQSAVRESMIQEFCLIRRIASAWRITWPCRVCGARRGP